MKLIVTVPHVCLDNVHDAGCDERADKFAKFIGKLPNSTIFFSGTPRYECDLNRKHCRNVGMRDELAYTLTRLENNAILLDVHSFWGNAFPGYDFAVMHDEKTTAPAAALCNLMIEAGLNVDMKGARLNDIITEARQHGIPACVLEIRDDLSLGDLWPVMNVIKHWRQELSS